ncbi:hypothetical protein PCE1_003550 [Barthelona sp. PCE]
MNSNVEVHQNIPLVAKQTLDHPLQTINFNTDVTNVQRELSHMAQLHTDTKKKMLQSHFGIGYAKMYELEEEMFGGNTKTNINHQQVNLGLEFLQGNDLQLQFSDTTKVEQPHQVEVRQDFETRFKMC